MEKKKNNIWLTVGVIVVCILLLYWLFARTLIVEDEGLEGVQGSTMIEQGVSE